MKLKQEWINTSISHNGIKYDLTKLNDEQLMRVWETNPSLRYLFEETPEEEFFNSKPEDKTEEEFFEEVIKKATTTKRTPKNKR